MRKTGPDKIQPPKPPEETEEMFASAPTLPDHMMLGSEQESESTISTRKTPLVKNGDNTNRKKSSIEDDVEQRYTDISDVVVEDVENDPDTPRVAHPSYTRRPATLPLFTKLLIILLALALFTGGIGLVVFTTTNQYRASIQRGTAKLARATRDANNTAQARVQGTANALGTAQANIEASATAAANQQAAATAAVANLTATATSLNDFYTQSTNGAPVLDDPLNDNTGSGRWDEGGASANTGCSFSGNKYHVKEAQQGYFQPCVAQATRFSSFAYQVHLTFDQGNQGQAGLLFRTDIENKSYYFFYIGTDGSYSLDLYNGGDKATNLLHGTNSAILQGLNQANQIAVVANSDTLYLYANGQFLNSVLNSSLSVGKVGLGVVNKSTPVDVEFSDVQVWQLQSSAQPGANSTSTPDAFPGFTPTADALPTDVDAPASATPAAGSSNKTPTPSFP